MSPTPPPEQNILNNEPVTATKQDFFSFLGLTGEDQLPTSGKALEAMLQLMIEKERVAFETLRNSNLKLALEFLNCSLKAQIPPHLIPSMFPTYENKLTKRKSDQEPLVVANMTFPQKTCSDLNMSNTKHQDKASSQFQTGAFGSELQKEVADTSVDKTIPSTTNIEMKKTTKANATDGADNKKKRKESELKVRHWQKTTPRNYSYNVEKLPRSPFAKHKSSVRRPSSSSGFDISKVGSTRVCSTDSVSSTVSLNEGTPETKMSNFKPDNYKARAFDKAIAIPSHLVNHPHSYPPTHLPAYPMKLTDPMTHSLPPFFIHNAGNIHGPPHPDLMYREFVTVPPHYSYPYPVPQVLKPTKLQPSSLELRHVSVQTPTAANPGG